MKMIKKMFFFILVAVFLWCAVCIIKPFWNRYFVEKDMEVAAIYRTKNSFEDTKKLLAQKMEERGLVIKEGDFSGEKDEKNRVFLSLHYSDEIRVFGRTLKQLEFSLKATTSEIREYF